MIVAHGDVEAADRDVAAGAALVIAADGGAFALERWGILPHVVVGDLDSLGAARAGALRARGVSVLEFPAAKDESDLELALRHALASGADEIVLLGAFGGARLDHAIANAMLLADPAYRGHDVRARWGAAQVRALHAGERVAVTGPVVTLLPVRGDAVGVRTRGLRYPLAGETLRFGRSRGLSNVVDAQPADVSLDEGVLLVIETQEGGNT